MPREREPEAVSPESSPLRLQPAQPINVDVFGPPAPCVRSCESRRPLAATRVAAAAISADAAVAAVAALALAAASTVAEPAAAAAAAAVPVGSMEAAVGPCG